MLCVFVDSRYFGSWRIRIDKAFTHSSNLCIRFKAVFEQIELMDVVVLFLGYLLMLKRWRYDMADQGMVFNERL